MAEEKKATTTWSRDYAYVNKRAGSWIYTIFISTSDMREMYVEAIQENESELTLADGFLPAPTTWNPNSLDMSVRQYNRAILSAFDKAIAKASERVFDPSKDLEKIGFRPRREE